VNYEDERYVRLFVRNTPTYCGWKWEARAVLGPLLRALFPSGRIEWTPGADSALSLAAVLMLPVKVVAVGVREMERTHSITSGDGWLEMPNYIPGQTAMSSTAAERTAKWKKKNGYPTTRAERGVETRGNKTSPQIDVETPSRPSLPEQPPKPPKGGRPKRGESEPKPIDPRVEVVLAAIDRERIRHTLKPLPPSERHERPILTRLEDGVSVAELCLAVELHSRDRGGSGRLTATTPFTGPSGRGPGGWSWSRRLLDEHAARPQSQANGRSYDLTPEQIEARLAASGELPAWAEEGDA
jgi:hypothetical protein